MDLQNLQLDDDLEESEGVFILEGEQDLERSRQHESLLAKRALAET